MPKLKPLNIADLPDVLTAKDIAAALRCSLGSAYKNMQEIGEFRPGRCRRVFKNAFIGWLKTQGYVPDDPPPALQQAFWGANNSNKCTVR